jgi:DNA polymerase-3 subunit gamma/tau
VLRISGASGPEFLCKVVEAIACRDASTLIRLLDYLFKSGGEAGRFVSDLAVYYRNILVCMMCEDPSELIESSDSAIHLMQEQAMRISRQETCVLIRELSSLENSIRWVTNPRILVEATLIKLCKTDFNLDGLDILAKFESLEAKLNTLLRAGVSSPQTEDKIAVTLKETHASKLLTNQAETQAETVSTDNKQQNTLNDDSINKLPEAFPQWENFIRQLHNCPDRMLQLYMHDTKAYSIGNDLYIVFKDKQDAIIKAMKKEDLSDILISYLKETIGVSNNIKYVTESEFKKNICKSDCSPDMKQAMKEDKLKELSQLARKNGIPFEIIN